MNTAQLKCYTQLCLTRKHRGCGIWGGQRNRLTIVGGEESRGSRGDFGNLCLHLISTKE